MKRINANKDYRKYQDYSCIFKKIRCECGNEKICAVDERDIYPVQRNFHRKRIYKEFSLIKCFRLSTFKPESERCQRKQRNEKANPFSGNDGTIYKFPALAYVVYEVEHMIE
jgi:hypothetical protein